MYQCILFVTLFLSKPFQYKCEIKGTRTKIQAIIMPFDKPEHKDLNFNEFTTHTNHTQNKTRSNIKFKKIYMTIQLKKNIQEYLTNDEVVIIDQVYNVITSQMNRLINPYIIVIRQDEVLESYKLKHLKMVNAEVKEKVFNKESDPHYMGCYTDVKRSSCNTMMANNVPIKYSEGFCCSCEMATNIKRQLNDCHGRSRFKHVIHTARGHGVDEFETVIDRMIDNMTASSDETVVAHNKRTRTTKQIRGGQNCNDLKTPAHVDEPYRYHESSHCLQFSDLWYNVNKLESASYFHSVTISVYEKHTTRNEPAYREIISKVKLSTKHKNYINSESTAQANYVSLTFEDDQYYSLDIDHDRLLIPEKVPSVVEHLYPQATDDPNKYLIVSANNISVDGDKCNKVGVSYEAFYKQYNRCGEPRSSCLNNQPSHLWRHDMNAMDSGKPGSYFLENFVKFPRNKDILQKINGIKTLNLLYEMDYTSDFLIRTDTNYNSALLTRSLIEIVEIYSDATKSDQTKIVAAIYNTGMEADVFQVQLLTHFPINTGKNYTKIQSQREQIFPFHRYNYVLIDYGFLAKPNINCTLQVLDKWNNVIAWRYIQISEANRCFCVWKCECSCTTIEHPLFTTNCKTMSKKHYNKAGFRGAPPTPILNHNARLNKILSTFILIAYWIIVILIGITKAIIGLCYKPISSFGLHLIFQEKSKNLKYYLEPEIYSACVIYDKDGYAVHPYTKYHTIQLVSKKREFLTNIFYLALIFIYYMKKCFFIRMCKNIKNKTSNKDYIISEENIKTEHDYENDKSNYDIEEYQKIIELSDELSDVKSVDSLSLKSTKEQNTSNDLSHKKCNLQIHIFKKDIFMEILLNKDIVYYNNYKMNNKKQIIYSISERLVQRYSNFYYPSLLNQTFTFDGTQFKTSKKILSSKYNVVYCSKEKVIMNREISLSPRGINAL